MPPTSRISQQDDRATAADRPRENMEKAVDGTPQLVRRSSKIARRRRTRSADGHHRTDANVETPQNPPALSQNMPVLHTSTADGDRPGINAAGGNRRLKAV